MLLYTFDHYLANVNEISVDSYTCLDLLHIVNLSVSHMVSINLFINLHKNILCREKTWEPVFTKSHN